MTDRIKDSKTLKVKLENSMYITMEEGGKKIFINGSKSGTDDKASCEAIQRLSSLAIKNGATTKEVIAEMKGIKGGQQYNDLGQTLLSTPDAIAKGLEILSK